MGICEPYFLNHPIWVKLWRIVMPANLTLFTLLFLHLIVPGAIAMFISLHEMEKASTSVPVGGDPAKTNTTK